MTAYSNYRKIPRIKGLSITNHLPFFRLDVLKLLNTLARNSGDIGTFYFGPFKLVLLNSAKLYQEGLVEKKYTLGKGEYQRRVFGSLIGKSIFTSDGPYHHKQRKMLAPAFNQQQIGQFADVIAQYSENLLADWGENTTIDIAAEMRKLAMQISAKVFFGLDDFEDALEFGNTLVRVSDWAIGAGRSYFSVPLSWPTPANRRIRQDIESYRNKIQSLIDIRRGDGNFANDFLSQLLAVKDENGQHLTDKQVSDEAVGIFLGGYDNPSFAMPWTLYILSQHPTVYAKVQAEVDHVLQGRTPTLADYPKLTYITQVFKEVMRLYTPVFAMPRAAEEDLSVDGYFISKGQMVCFSPYTLHRRPDYYPDPEKFDPDRFSAENEKKRPRYAYMPFGAGPHVCIGNHFTMLECVLSLATIIQRVSLELVSREAVELIPMIVLKCKNPIPMRVSRRTPILHQVAQPELVAVANL